MTKRKLNLHDYDGYSVGRDHGNFVDGLPRYSVYHTDYRGLMSRVAQVGPVGVLGGKMGFVWHSAQMVWFVATDFVTPDSRR